MKQEGESTALITTSSIGLIVIVWTSFCRLAPYFMAIGESEPHC